jgi:hypothetical protein
MIVTVDPLAPAVRVAGDTAAIAGMGFVVGGGAVEALPPPHPDKNTTATNHSKQTPGYVRGLVGRSCGIIGASCYEWEGKHREDITKVVT